MNIYFFASKETQDQEHIALQVLKLLRNNMYHRVVTNIEPESLTRFLQEHKVKAPKTSAHVLDNIDAFVVQHHKDEGELGYVLSFALARKKPLVYLAPKYGEFTQTLKYLKDLQSRGKPVKVRMYDAIRISKIINEASKFFLSAGSPKRANIKFTLRLTHEIAEYLIWRCQRNRRSKADFLRDFIHKQLIEADSEYEKYKKRKDKDNL